MTDEFKINLIPSKADFITIESWLKSEYEKHNEGFYCNWNIIEKSYHDNELVSFSFRDEIIGFLVWTQDELVVDIDILEIHPDYRKKGFGRIFFNLIENAFKEKGNLAFVLFCEPRESEKFWRKMGFKKFLPRGYSESDLTFFKPLIKIAELDSNNNNSCIIELWNVEPYQASKYNPKWSWNFELKNGKLENPILHPCNRNWNVRWTKNGNTIKEDKVKYFSRDFTIENGPFMFIEKLNDE